MVKHLSPSSMAMYSRCAKQYEYRYIEGIKIAPSASLVLGRSYHVGLETNFRQKVSSFEDEALDVVLDAYSDTFDKNAREVEDWEGQERGDVKDTGARLLSLYMVGDDDSPPLAPAVQPIMVEVPFEIAVEGMQLPLVGVIDLVREPWEGETKIITDHKTAGKTPSAAPGVQEMTYSMAYETIVGEVADYELHAALKLKKPRVEIVSIDVSAADRAWLLDNAARISEAVSRGAFPGNPNGWWCSEKWCGYWHLCRGRL